MQIQAYLGFNGNCREAFEFYAKVLNGKIQQLFTAGDVPPDSGMPPCEDDWKDKIMHASLAVGDAILLGADSPAKYYQRAAGFSVNLQINNIAEAERVYKELSEGSQQISMPMAQTFWAARFAMFRDRYDIPWMINCNPE